MDEFLDEPKKPSDTRVLAVASTVLMLAGLIMLVALGSRLLNRPAAVPAAPGEDPLVARGRTLYAGPCVSCHGPSGEGDGPIAGSLQGPPPGDLTDDTWTHGDRPEQVLSVIAEGIPESSMNGYRASFDEQDIRALAAYVYHLAGREVPEELRR